MDLVKVVGVRILFSPKERGLSQEELAHYALLNSRYFGQLESREKNITFKSLAKVCPALNITLTVFSE